MPRSTLKAVTPVVGLCLSGWTLFAQVHAGRLVGKVYDPSRAVIAASTVAVRDVNTNAVHRTVTNTTGDFVITPLDPGFYEVVATAPGFQTVVKTGIELLVGQGVRVDIELPVGDTGTKVEVNAEVPLVNTESGTLGQVITNTQIVDLPLNGRGFYELARLTTGAVLLPAGGAVVNRIRPGFMAGMTISGVRGNQIGFLTDGMDVSDNLGGTYVQTSIDAIQEFSVQQNAYSAEFNRAGGLFNLTTKSGTNAFHGNLFEFLRNDKLDARDFFAPRREVLKRNQFGGTFGGPLTLPRIYEGKDKTFFFFSYDSTRERQGQVFNNIVPATAVKNGDFSAPGLKMIYDPLSSAGQARTPFAGNVIPPNRVSRQAQFFSEFIPAPNTAAGTFVHAPATALDLDQFTIRVDQMLSSNHKLFGRYSFHDNSLDDPNAFPALGRAPLKTRGQNVGVSLTSTLRPNIIHEFRFSYIFGTLDNTPFLAGTDFLKAAGIKGFEDTVATASIPGSFPDFTWSGYAAIRGSAFDQRPKTQDRESFDFMDNVTWVKGKHIVKFGGMVRKFESLFSDARQYVGLWNFSGVNTENPARPAGTGDAFADWALGLPNSVQRAFPTANFGGDVAFWHFFAHDDVRVTDRLTLNIGMRYEYSPWMKGHRGQIGTFDGLLPRPLIVASATDRLDLEAQPASRLAYPLFADWIQTSSQAGLPITITHPDKRQWAPRFGMAWRPWGARTVLRGGYGIFYESETSSRRTNITMIPFKLDEQVFNDRGVQPTRNMADFFQGSVLGSASTAPTINPTYTKLRMGYDQHWNFGIQRGFGAGSVIEANYVGNRGLFLAGDNDFNLPGAGPGAIQSRRPFPRLSRAQYRSGDVSTTYHSLQLKTEKRFSRGLWYLASYTWSKSLTHQSAPHRGGNTAWEKALTDFDIPHNFSLSSGYELPFGKGKPWLSNAGSLVNGMFGGWQVQGILGLRSGRPFTPTISRDIANNGLGGQRPDRLRPGTVENPTVERWFDASAFALPAAFTFGNSGGSILREDSFEFVDFSIAKVFKVNERAKLQFRAEFFNLTNTPNFGQPNAVVDTAAGGLVTSTSNTPRQVQFGLKLTF